MSSETFREWWNEHQESMLEMDWDCVAEAAWNAEERRMKDEIASLEKQLSYVVGIGNDDTDVIEIVCERMRQLSADEE